MLAFFVACQKTPYTQRIYYVQANKKHKHHTHNAYTMCKQTKSTNTNRQNYMQLICEPSRWQLR